MNQAELERLAARLGTLPAESIDADRVATRVLARLDEAKVRALSPRTQAIRWLGGLAAAALLVLTVRLAVGPSSHSGDSMRAQRTVLQELDELDVSELEELLETMPVTASALPPETAPLQELDTTKLERLLRSLEG